MNYKRQGHPLFTSQASHKTRKWIGSCWGWGSHVWYGFCDFYDFQSTKWDQYLNINSISVSGEGILNLSCLEAEQLQNFTKSFCSKSVATRSDIFTMIFHVFSIFANNSKTALQCHKINHAFPNQRLPLIQESLHQKLFTAFSRWAWITLNLEPPGTRFKSHFREILVPLLHGYWYLYLFWTSYDAIKSTRC